MMFGHVQSGKSGDRAPARVCRHVRSNRRRSAASGIVAGMGSGLEWTRGRRGSGFAARFGVGVGFGLVLSVVGPVGLASANPEVGEHRSILRDLDHPTTVIAGEADGAATVMNPANLGFLRGLSGVVEGSLATFASARRGSGLGAFVGLPLGLKALGLRDLVAIGVGYQVLFPRQIDAFNLQPGFDLSDARFHKLTFALALPLLRWVDGLSVGIGYSRLFSRSNPLADGVHQLDLSLSYRAHRRLGLGLVVRGVNVPKVALAGAFDVHPLEIDPEVALRPLGIPNFEIAVGGRILPLRASGERSWPFPWQPRLRAHFSIGRFGLFSEVERIRLGVEAAGGEILHRGGVRWLSGLSVDLRHVGIAGGPGGGAGSFGGGALRLRLSAERYDAPPLSGPRRRRVLRIRLRDYRGDRRMAKLVELLEEQPRAALVLIETRGMGYGWAQAEEVREALMRLRDRDSEVVAYLEGASLGSYFVASAADRIIAHPHRRLSIVGIRVEVFYYGEILAKLGARAEFLRIAEYKSRPETYERGAASKPVADQRRLSYADLFGAVLASIADGRGASVADVKEWVDAAPFTPEQARAAGLVDAIAYADGIQGDLEAWLGRPVVIREVDTGRPHADELGRGLEIAVVHIEGILRGGSSFRVPLVGQRIAGSKTLTEAIDRVRVDPHVGALVVRIDSIGGSVAAAAAITRSLERVAEEKPVIISFGNVAASGGYYVATAGSVIFSDALTATGSIGIFLAKVDLSGLFAKLGVGIDRLSFGAAAATGSWTKPYNDLERAVARRGIERSYEIFTARVADARGLDRAGVDALARGRVWRGLRAIQRGLADHDGGLHDAISHARGLLGRRGSRARVVHLPAVPGIRAQLTALGGLRLPFSATLGALDTDAPEAAIGGAELALLGPLLPILRRLPINLWLVPSADELAMAPEFVSESR